MDPMKRKARVLFRLSGFVLVSSLAFFALGVPCAEAEEPFDTVMSYAEALRTGDTIRVKSLIGGRLYEKRELLLDQNEEYPDYLRKFYDGAVFQVSNELTDLGEQGQGVGIEIRFPSGHRSEIMAIVEQAPDGSWMIVDEIEPTQ
jgi:hypothetical protein